MVMKMKMTRGSGNCADNDENTKKLTTMVASMTKTTTEMTTKTVMTTTITTSFIAFEKSIFARFSEVLRRDGRTDTPEYRDARTHLKRANA